MARLPQPGGDDGAWGEILNDFLSQAHNTDGTLKGVGQAGGLASLDGSGKVPITQIPASALPSDANIAQQVTTDGSQTNTAVASVATTATTAQLTTLAPTLGQYYAPGAVPSSVTGGPFKNGYDRRLNVYNLTPASLSRARAKLARAKAGLGTFSIATLGESTTAGHATGAPGSLSWPAWLRKELATAGYPSTGTGPCVAFSNTGDSRLTIGAGWVPFSLNSNLLLNNTTSNPLSFTSDTSGTTATVIYSDAGGPFTVTVDGGSTTTITPTGEFVLKAHAVTGLPDTPHTISVARMSGMPFIHSFEVSSNTTAGVRLCNSAVSGNMVSTLAANDNWSISYFANGSYPTLFSADLITLQIMINDKANGTTAADWKASMQTAITNTKTNGADVILIVTAPVDGGDFSDYRQASYELSDAHNIPLIDMTDRWGDYAQANSYGLMFDGWHPNEAGYAEQGRAIFHALGL